MNENDILDLNSVDNEKEIKNNKFSFSSITSLFKPKNKLETSNLDENIVDLNQLSNENVIEQQNISSNQNIENDIFKELDLWDLSFGDLWTTNEKSKKEFNPLSFTAKATNIIFINLLTLFILFNLNLYIKSTDSEFITSIPILCDYIWSSIEWYDNSSNCTNFPSILSNLEKDYDASMTKIAKIMTKILPQKIWANFITMSPEVKFIIEKNWDDRIILANIFEEFEKIRAKSWWYEWLNIECSNFKIDEKWTLDVSCDFFGSSIWWWASNLLSSRWVAFDFINNLEKSNIFSILNYPKVLDVSKYSSVDWIKSLFSTKTSYNFNLKFISIKK